MKRIEKNVARRGAVRNGDKLLYYTAIMSDHDGCAPNFAKAETFVMRPTLSFDAFVDNPDEAPILILIPCCADLSELACEIDALKMRLDEILERARVSINDPPGEGYFRLREIRRLKASVPPFETALDTPAASPQGHTPHEGAASTKIARLALEYFDENEADRFGFEPQNTVPAIVLREYGLDAYSSPILIDTCDDLAQFNASVTALKFQLDQLLDRAKKQAMGTCH